MPLRLEIGGAEGSPDRELTAADLSDVNVVKPHTALSDFEATAAWDQSLRDRVTDPVRVFTDDGDLLFRGFMNRFSFNESDGSVTIYGPGIGDDLKDRTIRESFSKTRYSAAIRQIWQEYTDFDATVFDARTETVVSDQTVVDAPADQSFDGVAQVSATDPVITADVDADGSTELAQARVSWFFEGEELSLSGEVSDSNASGGTAEAVLATFQDSLTGVNPNYTIPSEAVGMAARFRPINDPDGDGVFEGAGFSLSVGGETVGSRSAAGYGQDTYRWVKFTGRPSDLTPGSYELTVDIDDRSNNGDGHIDAVVVYDDRQDLTFDNSVDADGFLSGPERYPPTTTIPFGQEPAVFNVVGINVDTSINDVSGDQSLSVSFDGGTTFLTDTNTETTDRDDPDNVGTTVDYRATLSHHGSRSTQSPTDGFRRQYINSLRVGYTGTNTAVIQSETYEGTPFDVLQKLHRQSDYRFVIDHSARDADGNLTRSVESFKTGDQTRPNDFTVVDRTATRDFTDYANLVTIRGRQRDDGTRPTVTVRSTSEIDDHGIHAFSTTDPNLTSLAQVRAAARAELSERLDQSRLRGSITIDPSDRPAGFRYPVQWFPDTDPIGSDAERIRWSVGSTGQLQGSVDFENVVGIVPTVVNQAFSLRDTTQSI